MSGILGLLSIALFIALIVGLIKPALVLRWTTKPTRLKVVGFWFLSFIIVGILGAMFTDNSVDSKVKIELANKYIKEEDYSKAISTLKKIEKSDTLYNTAQILLAKADSLTNVTDEEKKAAKDLLAKKTKEEEVIKQKEQLERELKSIDKGIDFSTYRGTVDALQIELVLFGSYANIIMEGENSNNKEIKALAAKLKSKVKKIQIKEFPKLRKDYAKVIAKLLWENDIDVSANGKNYNNLNFTAGIFAANKNKQDFQEQLKDAPKMFRFGQTRYRWYKGQDEYTYYTIYEGKDSDLVTFK